MEVPTIDHYRDAARIAPSVLRDRAVWKSAARLLAVDTYDPVDHPGALGAEAVEDDHASIISDMGTLLDHARLKSAGIGDVDELRASHAWIDDYVTQREHDSRSSSLVPDYYVSTRAETTVKRSNSGKSVTTVVRYGKPWIFGTTEAPTITRRGDFIGPIAPNAEVVPSVAEALLSAARRSRGGTVNGADVTRITNAAYGDSIPKLLGGDSLSFEQVIHHESGVAADDKYGIARHTVGSIDRKPDLESWRDRYGIRIGKRNTEEERVTLDRVGPVYRTRTALWASADQSGYAFIGHKKVKRDATVEVKRLKKITKVKRTITGERQEDLVQAILEHGEVLGLGERAEFLFRNVRLSVTRSKGDKWSSSAKGKTIQTRSLNALLIKLNK